MSNLFKHLLTGGSPFAMGIAHMPARDAGEPIGIVELEDNLDDVEKPPEVPNGIYEGEVQLVEEKDSDAGNTYYAMTCIIPTEELPAEIQEFYPEGALMSYNRVVKPKGRDRRRLYRIKELLQALGLPTNVTSYNPDDWMGRPVRIQTVQTKYQGEYRAGIRALLLSTRAAEAGNGYDDQADAGDDSGAEDEPAPAPRRRAAPAPKPAGKPAPRTAGRR